MGLGETHILASLKVFVMGNNNFTVTTQTAVGDNSLYIVSVFFQVSFKFRSINILLLYKYTFSLSTSVPLLFSDFTFTQEKVVHLCYFLLY